MDTQEPQRDHVEQLAGYGEGDGLEITVWDDDDGDDPETGDLLGRTLLSAEQFWPHGMKTKNLSLEDAGKADATVRIEIVVQAAGCDPPQPTSLNKEKKEKKEKKDKKRKKRGKKGKKEKKKKKKKKK